MATHTCLPGHAGILADDCERCTEHANETMLLHLDYEKTEALWDKMVAVEFGQDAYETLNEKLAASQFHRLGIWLERHVGIRPWVPFTELQGLLRREPPEVH